MPYVYDPNLEDDNETLGQGVQISGASPTTDDAGGGGDESGPSENKDTGSGSGFQNLDKYLQTNESQAFGNQVLGKVENEVTQAKQNQTQASEKFGQQVNSANELPNQDQVNSAIANPTGADKGQFQNWLSQSYQGPQNLADSQDTWNQYWSGTNKANTAAQQLGSEPGRFALLDNYFGRPNYSYGEKSLDNLLVQQSGLGDQTKALQNEATQLKAQGQNEEKTLQGLASQRAGEVNQSRQNVRSAIGIDDQGGILSGDQAGAIGKSIKSVQDQVAAENLARKNQADAFGANYLDKNRLDPRALEAAGIPYQNRLYNLNLRDYLTPGADLSANQVMSPEQQAYIKALTELAGVNDTFASGPLASKSDPYSYDYGRLKSDLGSTDAAYIAGIQDINRRFGAVNQSDESRAAFAELQKKFNPNRHLDYSLPGIDDNEENNIFTRG